MNPHPQPSVQASEDLQLREQRTTELVERWLRESNDGPADGATKRLAAVLADPNGLRFTVDFVDGVIRPEDAHVAAAILKQLAPAAPASISPVLRGALRAGGAAAPLAPGPVIQTARKALRQLVRHLVVDATDAKLGRAITRLRTEGIALNVNLLGEAVLGKEQADRRLRETERLLSRPDIDYVSVKVSAVDAPHSPWAFDETVTSVVERLTPLMRRARDKPGRGFVNLDMEEYRDLELTIAVFTTLLDKTEFHELEAGIVLQAYLPDALAAMMRLQEWAATRVASGGSPIKVRLVKGANLPMEQVEAALHGWPLATWPTKQDTDTNYKRVLDWALHPERTANIRLGIAGHNLFDIADSWLLANDRGVADRVQYEMLLGMASAQADAIRRTVGGLLLYTPVVDPAEFDVAIAYLVRRLEETASPENFLSGAFRMATDGSLLKRERDRYVQALRGLDDEVPEPNRTQDRRRPEPEAPHDRFQNAADTDPSLPANLAWGREILARVPTSKRGEAAVEAAHIESTQQLELAVGAARWAGPQWAALGAEHRRELLHRVGDALAAARGELLEVMASETGKTLQEGDPEISEAIDFAHYYAEQATQLEHIDGARFEPASLTVVAPPWNFPVSIPAGSTIAALATGSAVLLKPAPEAQRCAAMLAEAIWSAGVPQDVLQLVVLDEQRLGAQLIGHRDVDRVILTGAFETAERFRSFRSDLPLLAETSGKNAIVVTPSADLDLAVRDVVASAFGHAGQKCSAASLVILVGSVARSQRFRRQMVDAARSLDVGVPADPRTQMGPLILPAAGKLRDALTTLEPGQQWLLEPRQLDEAGRQWTPGIRGGVLPGSQFHRTEYFGPVLGVMAAETLAQAIEFQNGVDYGLTAGLHSLDRDQIALWLDGVQAGNLYVNRGVTGAVVNRQPFGGWKRSAVGPGAKAGGPNYLLTLGCWQSVAAESGEAELTSMPVRRLLETGTADLTSEELASLKRATAVDADVWAHQYGTTRDIGGLDAERNVLRYRPTPVAVRRSCDASLAALVRVCAAGLRAGASFEVSSAAEIPEPLRNTLQELGVTTRVEDTRAWCERIAKAGIERVRVIGSDGVALTAATAGAPQIAVYDGHVTEAGRIELLPFLREQAVSITAHRFGTPTRLTDGLL
jgi:RHH-type transcriptional regulator, proline utilization regulon repressor / proline dehydrogenase / delta 1-pyrroline-5-carboxylate dehydrogenase